MRLRATLVVLVAGVGAATAASSSTAEPPPDPAPNCAATVAAEYASVARRVYDQALDGSNLRDAVRRLQRSRTLATAVRAGDPVATRAALRPLLRADIVRIVVTRDGHRLAASGGRAALAPVSATVAGGAGRVRLSVLGDAAFTRIVHGLTGARVTLRAGDDGPSGPRHAPAPRRDAAASRSGPLSSSPRAPASRLDGTAFPSGPLAISLHAPAPRPSLCRPTVAATRAKAIAAVGRRLYTAERTSAQTRHVLALVAHDPRFARAVATADPAALRSRIVGFFEDPSLHVVRIRAVTRDGTLVNDVGGPYVLAPVSAPVREHGRIVGTVTLSIQDDTGYIKLVHRFTGARAILRTPAGIVPGSATGAGEPVASFAATAFPDDPLRISLLITS
jgi:hypothetical protein